LLQILCRTRRKKMRTCDLVLIIASSETNRG
jgi:hypothetical protein